MGHCSSGLAAGRALERAEMIRYAVEHASDLASRRRERHGEGAGPVPEAMRGW